MDTADLAVVDACALRDLARRVYRAERVVAGYKSRLAAAAAGLEADGSGPAAHDTLAAGGELSKRGARDLADQTAALSGLPAVARAAQSGQANPENVVVLARAMLGLSATNRDRLTRSDGVLAHQVTETPPDLFAKTIRDRVSQLRGGDGESLLLRQRAASGFTVKARLHDPLGMWGLTGELDPERAATVADRINSEAKRLAGGDPATAAHRAAALVSLVCRNSDDGAASKMGIGVIHTHECSGASTAETWRGEPVDPSSVARLACDADLHHVRLGANGVPLWPSVESRTATREQRLALRALYPTCPIDETSSFADCEVHHVVPVKVGGVTQLANLLPLSWSWHHNVHEGGWKLTLEPDRTIHLHRPDGTLDRTIPPPTPITRHGP